MIGPIAICIHSYNAVDFSNYFNHLYCVANWAQKYQMMFVGKRGLDAAAARNAVVERAIQMDCTHALFLDEDHFFPVQLLDILYESADAAMVSGVVCKKGEGYQQVGWEVRPEKDGLGFYSVTLPLDGRTYQTHVCAFGCTLINLAKLKKLDKPYFRDTCVSGCDGSIVNIRSDVNLCLAFRDAKEEVYIDTRALIGHAAESTIIYPQTSEALLSLHKIERELVKLREGQIGYYYYPGDRS